jgi:hypothetical protein
MLEEMQTRAELYDTLGSYEALDASIIASVVPGTKTQT